MPPSSTKRAIAPAARQTKSAECALTTRSVPGVALLDTGEQPCVGDGHRAHIIVAEACLEQAIRHQREPVFDRWVLHLTEIRRENVVLRPGRADRVEGLLPRDLAAVDRREAPFEHRTAFRELALLVD